MLAFLGHPLHACKKCRGSQHGKLPNAETPCLGRQGGLRSGHIAQGNIADSLQKKSLQLVKLSQDGTREAWGRAKDIQNLGER